MSEPGDPWAAVRGGLTVLTGSLSSCYAYVKATRFILHLSPCDAQSGPLTPMAEEACVPRELALPQSLLYPRGNFARMLSRAGGDTKATHESEPRKEAVPGERSAS